MEICRLDQSYFELLTSKYSVLNSNQSVMKIRSESSKNVKLNSGRLIELDRIHKRTLEGNEGSLSLCNSCAENITAGFDKNKFRLSSELEAYKITEQPLISEMLNAPDNRAIFKSDIDKLKDIAEKCDNDYFYLLNNRRICEISTDDELKKINELEYSPGIGNEEISALLRLAESSTMSNLFSSDSIHPLYNIQFTNTEISEINGLRLAYQPIPKLNLNWSEINAAWSCLALALESSIQYHQSNLPVNHFSFTIIPMRHRSYLLQNKIMLSTNENKRGLCLEGGYWDNIKEENATLFLAKKKCSSSTPPNNNYTQAVLALAVTLIEVIQSITSITNSLDSCINLQMIQNSKSHYVNSIIHMTNSPVINYYHLSQEIVYCISKLLEYDRG